MRRRIWRDKRLREREREVVREKVGKDDVRGREGRSFVRRTDKGTVRFKREKQNLSPKKRKKNV
jgi:hypothetical protein